MCVISKERIVFCTQVEGMRGEIFAASPIALYSQCKGVPNGPIPTYGDIWPQLQIAHLKYRIDKVKRNSETALRGRYAMQGIVLMPGRVISQRGISDGSDRARPL